MSERFDDPHRVRRRAADVGLRLHLRRGVDVGHDCQIRIDLAELVAALRQGFSGDRVRQASSRRARSGRSTVFCGFRILAVSAMKWTPQKTITSASTVAALRASSRLVADEVRHLEDLGTLIVVREHHRTTRLLEVADLADQRGDLGASRAIISLVAQAVKMFSTIRRRRLRLHASACATVREFAFIVRILACDAGLSRPIGRSLERGFVAPAPAGAACFSYAPPPSSWRSLSSGRTPSNGTRGRRRSHRCSRTSR